ncbi:MAG: hypothetical protein A2Y39_06970 [Candidatus Delongbacteria bacterium GWF2_40_14]|nr:MAG: hypothetical protein A2Y39_06970 [Candidatus Delongbacteria bacterium GWF2_40_14]
MEPDDVLEIDISYSFNWEPDSIDFDSVTVAVTGDSAYSPIEKAYFKTLNNMLRIETKLEIYGHAHIEYTAHTSVGSATDKFLVRVEKRPNYSWTPFSTQYDILPENCLGRGDSMLWKAASVFDLGNVDYRLDCIEFGYGLGGRSDWKIVLFNGLPTDSLVNGLSGSKDFNGGYSSFIENLNGIISGQVAVVFSTSENFMAMETAGISDLTWIYTAASGWEHPDDISADYSGSWYIRLYVLDPSGIEQVFTNEKSPVLLRNYPNPFNNETIISWMMPYVAQTELDIFNSKGQLVKNLVNEEKNKGTHSVVFNADGMQTGIYFYQLKINGKIENSAKMLYLK